MKKSLLGVLTIGVVGLSATTVSAASNMNGPVQFNSKEAIVKRVEERFSDYKDTDRLLPVDGGYLDGTMTEKLVLNGKTIPGTEKKVDSHADISKTKTVAEIKKLEISYAEQGISSGVSKNSSLRFTNVPTKAKDLDPGQRWKSGGFNGGFLEFAGFFFQNRNGSFIQDWRVYGDAGLIGDSTDAWTTYNTAGVNTQGYLLNPSGENQFTAINSTNGYPQLTFYTFHPAAGSGYEVKGR